MEPDTQPCILGIKAEVWRKGHVLSLAELEATNQKVLPVGLDLADRYEDITGNKALLEQLASEDMFFWERINTKIGKSKSRISIRS